MYYQTLVKNLFNDMYHFLNGTQAIGLEDLTDNYQEEPLFLAFIGNLNLATAANYNEAMKECYAFYKKYCGRLLSEEEWDLVISDIKEFNQKWENEWCRGLILALLEILDQENKVQKADVQEPERGEAEGGAAEDEAEHDGVEMTDEDGQQEMETAA